ncbi:MAG: DNA recombination protein RmuC [Candidatus Nanopelagicales bacterium]
MSLAVAVVIALVLGLLVGTVIGWALSLERGLSRHSDAVSRAAQNQLASRGAAAERAAVEALVRPLGDTLGRVSDQLARAEVERAAAQAELREQVRRTAEGAESLRSETGRLVTALRRSEVRGRWGEVQLRRLVESSGLIEHVDFTEQHTSHGEDGDGTVRPDLVVHLADGRHVVVDAKVALSAYLDAAAATDDATRDAALSRHAHEVMAHVERLSAKSYWRRYDSPEFVVLFLPADALLASALDVRPDLLERAFSQDVVLATPTTLMALLRTVSYAWRQDAAARNAAEVHALGRELHTRLATMGGHLSRLGSSLDAAVEQFNKTIGSMESRVLVSARRLADLGVVTAADDDAGLSRTRSVTTTTRYVCAPDLTGGDVLPSIDLAVADTPDSVPYR